MLRASIGLSLLLFGTAALADGLDYNYIEGGVERLELDAGGADADGDGIAVGGSIEILERFHLFARYTATDFDSAVDLDEFAIGGGYHMPISTTVDLVASLSWVRADASAFGLSADDDGLGASLGVRAMMSRRLELNGAFNYVDLGDTGDEFSVSGAAWYTFTSNVALGVTAGLGDDLTRFGLGLRFYFDP